MMAPLKDDDENLPTLTGVVDLRQLVREPVFQVRRAISHDNVERLKAAYRSGRSVEPIRVAEVSGRPYLVDGWHRVEAMLALGKTEAQAVIVQGATLSQAQWMAAKANLNNGLPLKRKELLAVFKAFIASKKHRYTDEWGSACLLSYRQIAPHIGVDHTTIRRWMIAHYPRIAQEMAAMENPNAEPFRPHDAPRIGLSEREALAAIDQALEAFNRVRSKAARGRLHGYLQDTLGKAMKVDRWGPQQTPEMDDF